MPTKGISMEVLFLKTTGRLPSGLYAFRMSRSERAENNSLEDILMAGTEIVQGGVIGKDLLEEFSLIRRRDDNIAIEKDERFEH